MQKPLVRCLGIASSLTAPTAMLRKCTQLNCLVGEYSAAHSHCNRPSMRGGHQMVIDNEVCALSVLVQWTLCLLDDRLVLGAYWVASLLRTTSPLALHSRIKFTYSAVGTGRRISGTFGCLISGRKRSTGYLQTPKCTNMTHVVVHTAAARRYSDCFTLRCASSISLTSLTEMADLMRGRAIKHVSIAPPGRYSRWDDTWTRRVETSETR